MSLMISLFVGVALSKEIHYPFTDPHNRGNWATFDAMTDEFDGNTLDESKWYPYNPGWDGRQPGLFVPENVHCCQPEGNQLHMWAYGNVTLNSSMQAKGYNGYTTSAVKSKARLLYGYSEVRAKVGTSKISSAFWFNYNDGNTWTEIDIFEAFGPVNDTPYFYDQVKSHTHIFKLNGDSNINDLESKCHCQSESNSCTQGNLWTPPNIPNLSNDWHVYGMNWTASNLKIYFDNTLVWDIENSCLHQGLQLNFDRETMPNWVGLPSYSELPDTPFMIDYVRTWKN